MYTIREKVTEKLSRLFADSPNSSAASLASPFNDPQQPQLKHIQSLPCRQISEDFDQQNEPVDIYEEYRTSSLVQENKPNSLGSMNKQVSSVFANKQTNSVNDNDKDCASGSSSSDSDVYAEATDLPSPTKLLNLMDDSAFITLELYEFLQSSIPNIVKGCQWVLLYSTLKHGISLRTLIRNSAGLSGPCLLITGDMQGAVFGGLLECPLKPTPKRKYQGTNQTFVFTTIYGEPRLFRPTGANRYYYMCLNDLLALGGGGNFALCLNDDLLSGTSGPCETFGNLCLAHNQEFELKNVELWGFSHVSHYLT